MHRCLPSLTLAFGLFVLASSPARSAPVQADRSGLERVPATAPLVVHLRGVQGTRDRFVAMMQNALPDVLKTFQSQMDDFLENGRMGRKLRGVAKNGPHFFVLTELPKAGVPLLGPPNMAFIVAVTNYKEFRDNLLNETERANVKVGEDGVESAVLDNETVYFVDRKGYAILTPQEDVAKSFTKRQAGLNTKIGKEQAAKLLASDLGLYVNMETVNSTYGEQIKEGRKGLEQFLLMVPEKLSNPQRKLLDVFRKAIAPVFQAMEDSKAVVASLEFRPGGLALHTQSEIGADTPTASLLQDSRPSAFKDLESLPTGRSFYSGLKTNATLQKGMGGLISGFIPIGDSKEAEDALEELAKAGPTIRLDSYSFPLTGMQVYQYDDPKKAAAAQLNLFKSLVAKENKAARFKEKPLLKTDAEKHGGFQLHSVQLVWDFEGMAEALAAQGGDAAKKQFADSMKALLGEKTTVWFGSNGKALIQVFAPDWTSAKKMIDEYGKGGGSIGTVAAFRDVRKEMPAQASFVGLIDVVHAIGGFAEVLPALARGGPIPPGWPNVSKDVVGFIGISVGLTPQRGSLDTFISVAAIREFHKAVVRPFVGG